MTAYETSAQEWFTSLVEQYRDDPEYIAEKLVLDIIGDLCRAMEEQSVTKAELAQRLGTSPAFVSQVLNGKPNMTLLTLAKFAAALGLEPTIRLAASAPPPKHAARPRRKAAMAPGSERVVKATV